MPKRSWMYRFARHALAVAALALFVASPARAQVAVTSLDPDVHREVFAVSVNGVDVSPGSMLYLSRDGIVYANAKDLAAWKLEYPRDPSFTRDGAAYYALQSQLNLAVAVDHPDERLEIVAPRAAFIGAPDREREPATPGGGALLNYRMRRTDGSYDLFLTHDASAWQMRYESTQSSRGIALLRAQTRWYHLDIHRHRVWQFGDGEVNGGSVGTSIPFAGVHLASEFAKDPLFVSHELPSVRGVAATPSLVEVYVNDVLQWREEVPAGPFTVRDLPASAANTDVMLVLIDRSGNRSVQFARPGVDQEFLRPGLMSYSFDAGIGRVNGWQRGAYYRDGVVSALLRRGITGAFTAQLQVQSVAGKTFAAAGAQVRLGRGQSATISYGAGQIRRASELEYRLRTRKLEFREVLRSNAESSPTAFDPGGVFARFNESSDLRYDTGGALTIGLRLDRSASNSGSPTSLLSMETTYRLRDLDLLLRPSYDTVRHALSASLEITRRLDAVHSITQRVDAPAGSRAALALEYRKMQRDPDDPWTLEARSATGDSEERRLYLEDRMPWATASVLAQDQNGRGILEPAINGSLVFAGRRIYALRNANAEESIGFVHLPHLPNVRIKVNGADAGRTDKDGNLVLRNLSALEKNVVTADLSNVPIDEDVKDPEKVVPYAGTPVDVELLRREEQSVLLRIVDAAGRSLPPGSWITAEDGVRFPIGFDGRAYIHGVPPGSQKFTAANGCALTLTIAPRWEITDEGTVMCR